MTSRFINLCSMASSVRNSTSFGYTHSLSYAMRHMQGSFPK